MPQRAMTRASASLLQHKPRLSRQAGGERVAFQRLTHRSPLTSDTQPVMTGDTAAFPREKKQQGGGGGGAKHRRTAPPLPQETLMAGAQ